MLSGFEDDATFEFFGHKKTRDHALCPHCGKQGNKVDEGDLLWNERPKAKDYAYLCATCDGEWLIRRYINSGYEKYPQPPFACIYIPQTPQPDRE